VITIVKKPNRKFEINIQITRVKFSIELLYTLKSVATKGA